MNTALEKAAPFCHEKVQNTPQYVYMLGHNLHKMALTLGLAMGRSELQSGDLTYTGYYIPQFTQNVTQILWETLEMLASNYSHV